MYTMCTFIAVIAIFSLMENLNSDLLLNLGISAVLFLLFLSIVITLVHTVMLHRGLSLKDAGKGLIDPHQQIGVFLPVSSEEVNRIDCKYNMLDITCNSVAGEQNDVLVIMQNRGLLSSKDLEIQLDTTTESKLLYDISDVVDISVSGICIVAKNNVQHVKKVIESCTNLRILYPILKDKNLSLACKYVEFYDDVSKYCLRKGFSKILKKKSD